MYICIYILRIRSLVSKKEDKWAIAWNGYGIVRDLNNKLICLKFSKIASFCPQDSLAPIKKSQ